MTMLKYEAFFILDNRKSNLMFYLIDKFNMKNNIN
jgi:hypothetical protein